MFHTEFGTIIITSAAPWHACSLDMISFNTRVYLHGPELLAPAMLALTEVVLEQSPSFKHTASVSCVCVCGGGGGGNILIQAMHKHGAKNC